MKKSLWLLAALCLSGVAQAAGNDELWAVTTKMEMEGMPFAMPGQTSNVCIEKGKQNDPNRAVPADKDRNCTMSDVKVSGNRSSWKMKCTGKDPMTGSGEMTSGNGSYTGKMQMHSADGDMTMNYAGKRIGSCDYAKDNPSAQAHAMIAEHQAASEQERVKECKQALDDDAYSHFLKPDCSWAPDPQSKKLCAGMACPDMRPQMCARLSKRMSGSDEDYMDVAGNKDARKLTQECGLPYEKATRAFCKRQLEAKDYQKVAEYCDKEAKPLFDKHCAGRDYTAAMDSGYGPICQRYGKWKSSSGEDASAESKPNNSNPAKAILDGAKNLKGMFGF